jgi:hypothetical protein
MEGKKERRQLTRLISELRNNQPGEIRAGIPVFEGNQKVFFKTNAIDFIVF